MSSSAADNRRELALAVGLCLLSSAVALVAAGRPWAVGTVIALPPLPARELVVTASQAGAPVRGLALLGLTGAVAVLAATGWLRVGVGLLLLLSGIGLAAVGIGFDAAAGLAGQGPAPQEAARTWWPLVAAACGMALAAAGLLVVLRGRAWSGLSRRYDAPAVQAEAAAAPEAGPGAPAERRLWEALDRGEDPTAR